MTVTEKWLHEDACLFDTTTETLISNLLDEGHNIDYAISLIEETQNVKIIL